VELGQPRARIGYDQVKMVREHAVRVDADIVSIRGLFLSFGPIWQTVEVSHDAYNLEKNVIEPWGIRPYMALAELLKIADLG
jgi:hypothetical protein